MLDVSVKLFKPKGGVSSETTEIKPELAASPYAEEDSSTLQCGMLVISFLRAFSCCAVFVLHHPHSLLLGGKHQQEATCQKLVFPKKIRFLFGFAGTTFTFAAVERLCCVLRPNWRKNYSCS